MKTFRLLVACLVGALAATAATEPTRPNILLIVADDMGWADVSWHGGKFATPRMAEILKTSVELDRHYGLEARYVQEEPGTSS